MFYKVNKISDFDDKYLNLLLYNLLFLREEYPDFLKWFKAKVEPGIYNRTRKIYTVNTLYDSDKIRGVLILKDSCFEKKICTLFVDKSNRLNGIGKLLMNIAFEELETQAPLITVSDDKLNEFDKLLKKYRFLLFSKKDGLYRENHTEYSFNGELNNKNSEILNNFYA
ncbi:GNAT family N-acetyltransferase [uncultured Treponema sp.]|uniref:GNAT family N-acetyltransferase n=1 Tax=uncultured Treponema sp. TaxID=162155 RepID=UPI0025F04F4D|nr:GNAT family N-acetyltransferase [uncultured Treponema sp.]